MSCALLDEKRIVLAITRGADWWRAVGPDQSVMEIRVVAVNGQGAAVPWFAVRYAGEDHPRELVNAATVDTVEFMS